MREGSSREGSSLWWISFRQRRTWRRLRAATTNPHSAPKRCLGLGFGLVTAFGFGNGQSYAPLFCFPFCFVRARLCALSCYVCLTYLFQARGLGYSSTYRSKRTPCVTSSKFGTASRTRPFCSRHRMIALVA